MGGWAKKQANKARKLAKVYYHRPAPRKRIVVEVNRKTSEVEASYLVTGEASHRFHPSRWTQRYASQGFNWIAAANAKLKDCPAGLFYPVVVGTTLHLDEKASLWRLTEEIQKSLNTFKKLRNRIKRRADKHGLEPFCYATHWVFSTVDTVVNEAPKGVQYQLPKTVASVPQIWCHQHFVFFSKETVKTANLFAFRDHLKKALGTNYLVRFGPKPPGPSSKEMRPPSNVTPDRPPRTGFWLRLEKVFTHLRYLLLYPIRFQSSKDGRIAEGIFKSHFPMHFYPKILAAFIIATQNSPLSSLFRGIRVPSKSEDTPDPKVQKPQGMVRHVRTLYIDRFTFADLSLKDAEQMAREYSKNLNKI